MQDFLKEGSGTLLCAKFLKPRPLSIEPPSIFDRFGEKPLALPVSRSVFDLNHAKVSHNSSFIISLAREGDSIYPVISTS